MQINTSTPVVTAAGSRPAAAPKQDAPQAAGDSVALDSTPAKLPSAEEIKARAASIKSSDSETPAPEAKSSSHGFAKAAIMAGGTAAILGGMLGAATPAMAAGRGGGFRGPVIRGGGRAWGGGTVVRPYVRPMPSAHYHGNGYWRGGIWIDIPVVVPVPQPLVCPSPYYPGYYYSYNGYCQ